MTTLLCYLDPDRIDGHGPTVFMTERNQHQVHCGTCGTITYVDTDTFAVGSAVMRVGLDSPFRCEICKEQSDGH